HNAGKPDRQTSEMDEFASRFPGGLNSALRHLGAPSVARQVAQQMASPPMDLSDVTENLQRSVAAAFGALVVLLLNRRPH
ncbi:MAG: hypothetical protein ABW278_15430, partial [Steroidobacteraceae bacterium]